jgi:nucleotide-binding universal stress UspA family protein
MLSIKKILVPVDFSAPSAEAVRYGADIAQRYDASLTLAHVYSVVNYAAPEGFVLYAPDQLTQLLAGLQVQLDAVGAEALQLGAPRVDTRLAQGDPFTELLGMTADRAYDLIVMGTHGRTGIAHALLGSVAEKLVRKAACPVLTVRQPA